mmetsp:Transcript_17498/g.35933  ORF Transcript_17498/g.35933 Transcript_17498/m.35933 type:complete len:270 (-) Transcript_17498:150-959(-)
MKGDPIQRGVSIREKMIVFLSTFCSLLEIASSLSASSHTMLMMTSSSTSSPASRPFAINYKASILPEKRKAWLEQIKDDQMCTRKDEEGNLQFSITEDTESPNTFYLHEQFVDELAFAAHTHSPHFKRYDEFCNIEKPFDGEPEIFFYSPLEEGEEWSKNKRDIPNIGFCVSVNLYPKPEVRDSFLEVIKNNKIGTDNTEPLALQYTFGESTTEPNVFHFHEQYCGGENGKEGFDAHAASPHFADWESFVETDPFAKAPEVFFSKIIED